MLHTFVANAREEHDSFNRPPFYCLCGSLLIQRSVASQVANTTTLEVSLQENTVCNLYVHDEVSEPLMLDRKVNNGFANVDSPNELLCAEL